MAELRVGFRLVPGGTRKDPRDPNSSHRSLHRFSKKGIPPLLGTIILPEEGVWGEDLRWFTYWTGTELESLSPQRSTEPGSASGSGSAAAWLSAGSTQRSPSGTGGQGPGGVNKRPATQMYLSAEDPTRHPDNEPGMQLLTARAKRQHRQHATNYRFRNFTKYPQQAALVASPQDCAPLSASAALQCECSGA